MADFRLTVDLDSRAVLAGLQQIEAEARAAGERAGRGFQQGLTAQTKQIAADLTEQLNRQTSGGNALGANIGAAIAKGAQDGANKIPAIVNQALASTTQGAQRAGAALGAAIGNGAKGSLSQLLGSSIAASLASATSAAGKSGQQLGVNFASGASTSLSRLLPGAIASSLQSAPAVGARVGSLLGTSLAQSARSGISQTNLFAPLVQQGNQAAAGLSQAFRNSNAGILAASAGLRTYVDEQGRVRTSTGLVVAELERLNNGFRGIGAQTQTTRRSFLDLAGTTSIVQGAIGGLAFAMTNAISNAAGTALASVRALIQGYADLDSEIRLAAAAAGEAGGYDKLSDSINRVGIEASGTTIDVAKLATELVRGGLTLDQVNSSLAAIVRGAEATGTGFSAMGTVVAAALKSFGLEATEASRVVDALVQGANSTATGVVELGNGFKYAAPIAKTLGISIEDLAATIGLFANAGITAEEAGVALRNGLSKLAGAAPQTGGKVTALTGQAKVAAETMKELGVNIFNADGTMKPMQQTLLLLKGAFDKLGPSSKIRLAANLFGGEDDGAKFLAVLGQSQQEIKKVTNELAGSKGATDKARTAMQSFSLSVKQLQGTLDSIGVTMGKVAATALLPFISAANLIAGAISALPGPVKDLTAALLLLAGAYVTVRVGALAFGAALKTEAVIAAKAEILRLGVALRATLAQDLAAARAGVVAFFKSLNPQSLRAAAAALAGFAATAKVNLAAGMTAGAEAAQRLSRGLTAAAQSSQQAQAGLNGVSAVLNRGVTVSAKAGSGALLGVGKSLSALAAGTVTASLGALAAGLAGVAATAVSYNAIMSDANKTTQIFKPAITQLEAEMKKLGVPIADTTALGGPFNRFMQDAKGNIGSFVQSLVPIPGLGDAVAKSFDIIGQALRLVGIAQVTEAVMKLAGGVKQLYDTARRNQNILELEAGMNKVSAQATLATNKTTELIATLRSMPSGQEIDKGLNDQLIQNRANLEKNRETLVQVRDGLNQMAAAARAAGDTKYAEELELRAKRTGTEIGLIDVLNTKLEEQINGRKKSAAAIKAETMSLEELNKALKDREQSNQLKVLEAEVGILKQVAAGNLSVGEAAQQKQAVVAAGLRDEIALLDENIGKLSAADQAGADGLALKQQRAQKTVQLYQMEVDAVNKRIDAEKALNLVIAAAPNQALQNQSALVDRQIQGLNTLLGLGKALADLDQSRFDIAKSFNQYELSKLQERGASEGALRAKRREGEAIELAALQQKIKQQEVAQGIELKVLELTQQKAKLEAQMAVNTARVDLLEREQALQEAINSGDQAAVIRAEQGVALAQDKLGLSQQNLGLIEKLQPLEAATVLATQQTARNQLAAEAAAKGYGVAVDGSLRKITGTVGQFEALATITARTADEQDRFAKLAARTGLEAKKAADGTILIGKTIKDSRAGARGLAGSFTTLGNEAPGAADSTSEFSGFLQQGQNFVKGIVDLNLGGAVGNANLQAQGLALEMQSAAGAADRFYRSLREAAGLPAARWAGGPVAPGQMVRINDGPGGRSLGQESFLSSSGKLSLIQRPANSLWAAPSRGLVVPASVTEQLKAAGAFGPTKAIAAAAPRASGGDPGTAALAVEVAKLRVEVGELKRKRWDVHVNLRQDGSGLRMQKLLNGIR